LKANGKSFSVRACCQKTLLARKRKATEMISGLPRFKEVWRSTLLKPSSGLYLCS
jgi:hypothetical protein